MGGYGSTRWVYGVAKTRADDCRKIDVRLWYRKGLLVPNTSFDCRWYNDFQGTLATIGVQVREGGMVLSYAYTDAQGGKKTVSEHVPLCWTACNYGGRRPWLRCPECDRRVAVLYLMGPYFRCRHCHGLGYRSQVESERDRNLEKARAIRVRLGGSGNMFDPFPPKPKGMHFYTYLRLWHTSDRLWWGELMAAAGRFNIKLDGGS